jgi:hypothetical protein
VPAGLLRQWQDELREKGGLLVPLWDEGKLAQPDGSRAAMSAADAVRHADVVLLSREWARLEGNREIVLTAPRWDLVLVDEAHACRRREPDEGAFNSANLLLQLLRELQLRRRSRGILLLSATPMQTQPWEPWDLLTTLGVGGDWMVEFDDVRSYYRGLGMLRSGPLDGHTAGTIARLISHDDDYPNRLNGLATSDTQALDQALRFPNSKQGRDWSEWLRRHSPLGRRMHRNTRDTLRQYYAKGLLDAPPPSRHVRDDEYDYQTPAERQCYDAIEDYINQRYDQLEQEKPGKGFVMTIYRRRAASSPKALRETLKRRTADLDKVIRRQSFGEPFVADEVRMQQQDLSADGIEGEVDSGLPTTPEAARAEKGEIGSLLGRLDALGNADSKFDRFWQVLAEVTRDGRAVLIFTEYVDTMHHLRMQLAPSYGPTLGCYSGEGGQVWNGEEWVAVSKADITARLDSGELKMLVCTDAASEGLNLQSASALINYDLPWNPSKVEQRIGRIDRIGQQQPVLPIRNLFLTDSVDMRVYRALRDRCGLFEHFVGHMQPVLARARTALRENLRDAEVPALIADLGRLASQVDADVAASSAFVPADAVEPTSPPPTVDRTQLEAALASLSSLRGRVTARRLPKSRTWRVRGIGARTTDMTTDLETLERSTKSVPLSLGSPFIEQLASKLPLPARAPLVLSEYATEAFRCMEARWVTADRAIPVASFDELTRALKTWDGTPPPAAMLARAKNEAREAARKRVLGAQTRAQAAERKALGRQAEAARKRLRRELARTLRCAGPGDLTKLLREQLKREGRPDGRYHEAVRALGGPPSWAPEEVKDADRYADGLSAAERQARVNLPSEVEAALNDPRWKAVRGAHD